MACITTNPYSATLCTDANNYYAGSTSVDWQLQIPNNPAGDTYEYYVYLEKYDTGGFWDVIKSAHGSVSKDTGLKAFSLSGVPNGTYRLRLRIRSYTGTVWSTAYTTNFYISR